MLSGKNQRAIGERAVVSVKITPLSVGVSKCVGREKAQRELVPAEINSQVTVAL